MNYLDGLSQCGKSHFECAAASGSTLDEKGYVQKKIILLLSLTFIPAGPASVLAVEVISYCCCLFQLSQASTVTAFSGSPGTFQVFLPRLELRGSLKLSHRETYHAEIRMETWCRLTSSTLIPEV